MAYKKKSPQNIEPKDSQQPHDIEAEEAVIGSLLIDPYAIHQVSTLLEPADFFIDRHRWIYESMLALYENEVPIDLIMLADELEKSDRLEDIGGEAGLTRFINLTPSAINIEHYAGLVYKTAVLRKYIRAAGQIAKLAYQRDIELNFLSDQSDKLILNVRPTGRELDFREISALARNELERQEALAGSDDMTGIPTGLADLDKLLGGLQRSDMVVIAGRPGMGKTSLAQSIALQAARRWQKRVAIFSLEMSDEQLTQRLVSAESGIGTQDIRLGQIGERWSEFFDAVKNLDNLGDLILIDDTAAISVHEMRAKAKRNHILDGELDLLIIDYLQLMRGGSRFENRQQEISHISRSIKALAKELDIPIIALSQLSRAVEGRKDKRPVLSDLRESGSIEQDSDIVLFIYRDEVYNPDTEFPNIAEIIVAKHRSGPTGIFSVYFRKHLAQFVDLEIRTQTLEEVTGPPIIEGPINL